MKLKDLVKEESLTAMIQEQIQEQREEEAKQIARQVGCQIQRAVAYLRQCREQEKAAKATLKKYNDAIQKYDETLDRDVLRKAGLNV